MKEENKVYLFGAYFGTKIDGNQEIGNYLHEYRSMPSIDEMKNTIKKGNEELSSAIVLNMQFLTKEQFYAFKGEKPDEQQSELLDKKVTELNLSVRTTNICLSNGLNTVRDICRLAKTDWLKFRNGGKMSLSEVDNFLKYYGLNWGMNV